MTLYPIRGVFFMRKKKSIIGISVVVALFMVLTGCGKANSEVAKPIDNIDDNEVVQPVEAPEEPIVTAGFADDLAVKSAPVVYPKATLQYSGATNIRANDASISSLAETLNLDGSIFTATYVKNSGSDVMYLRTDGIWMYGLKNESTKGNKLTISMASGYVIRSIDINFVEGYSSTAEISSGGSVIPGTNGHYAINGNSFMIFVNDGAVSENIQVRFTSVSIEYEFPTAQEIIEYGLKTTASLSYQYEKEEINILDSIDKAFTSVGGSYAEWSGKVGDSTIVYAGNVSGRNGYININTTNSNSGIISTSNETAYHAKKVILNWNTDTNLARVVEVYGKNTAYASASELFDDENKGTLIGSMAYNAKDELTNQSTLVINAEYKYIGIRSHSDALYLNSVEIQWGEAPTYEYSDVAIRFGNLMEQSIWTRLNAESTIKGYGVMLSTEDYLSGGKIKDWYTNNSLAAVEEDDLNEAIATACGENVGAVKNFYTKITGEKTNPAEATAGQKGDLDGEFYIWNLYKNISTSPDNRSLNYTAVAYIRTASGIVFLKETTASVKSLANDLISTDSYDEESFDGSLNDLANLA